MTIHKKAAILTEPLHCLGFCRAKTTHTHLIIAGKYNDNAINHNAKPGDFMHDKIWKTVLNNIIGNLNHRTPNV